MMNPKVRQQTEFKPLSPNCIRRIRKRIVYKSFTISYTISCSGIVYLQESDAQEMAQSRRAWEYAKTGQRSTIEEAV